jgi:hypothetical protein
MLFQALVTFALVDLVVIAITLAIALAIALVIALTATLTIILRFWGGILTDFLL